MKLGLQSLENQDSQENQSQFEGSNYNSPVKAQLHQKNPRVSTEIKSTLAPSTDASLNWQEGSDLKGISPIAIDSSQGHRYTKSFTPMDKSPFANVETRKSSTNPLYVSRLIEIDIPTQLDPPANYDPQKLYFNDPEIRNIAESSPKYRTLTWKDPQKQSEYFRVLRESNMLSPKHYGHPEEVMELRLSQISGIPPKSLPQNRGSDVTQYSTLSDVKRELAQSNYQTRIRNSTFIDTSQRRNSESQMLKGSDIGMARSAGNSPTQINRYSHVIFSQQADNYRKSSLFSNGVQTDRGTDRTNQGDNILPSN